MSNMNNMIVDNIFFHSIKLYMLVIDFSVINQEGTTKKSTPYLKRNASRLWVYPQTTNHKTPLYCTKAKPGNLNVVGALKHKSSDGETDKGRGASDDLVAGTGEWDDGRGRRWGLGDASGGGGAVGSDGGGDDVGGWDDGRGSDSLALDRGGGLVGVGDGGGVGDGNGGVASDGGRGSAGDSGVEGCVRGDSDLGLGGGDGGDGGDVADGGGGGQDGGQDGCGGEGCGLSCAGDDLAGRAVGRGCVDDVCDCDWDGRGGRVHGGSGSDGCGNSDGN